MTTQAHTPTPAWKDLPLRLAIVGDTICSLDSVNQPASRIEWLQKFQRVYIVNAVNAYAANQALIAEQAAEIERYKAALEQVVKISDDCPDYHEALDSLGQCKSVATDALEKARGEPLQHGNSNPEIPCAKCGSMTFVYLQSGKRQCVVCQS